MPSSRSRAQKLFGRVRGWRGEDNNSIS
jgi:hypothetical protein